MLGMGNVMVVYFGVDMNASSPASPFYRSLCRSPAGQIMPHWLLCSWRGLAIFPSRPMGELMRRRCDSVDAYVSRLSTCSHIENRKKEWPVSQGPPHEADAFMQRGTVGWA